MQVTYFHCNQELGKMAVLGLLRHCIYRQHDFPEDFGLNLLVSSSI